MAARRTTNPTPATSWARTPANDSRQRIVRGLERAAEHQLTGIYNLGTGDADSVTELVAMLNAELGIEIKPEYVANPIPEDVYVHDTCADTSAFEAATGWAPAIDVEEGLRRVCAQYTDGTAETSSSQ